MKILLCIAFPLSCLTVACRSNQPSTLKAIVGSNQMKPYLKSDRISKAIGRMEIGCTVTHIGNGVAITAGHCLYSLTCNDAYYDVTWSFRAADKTQTMKSKCVKVLAHVFTENQDYAVLTYDSFPEASLPVNLIDRPKLGDALTLYSHPNGQALTWSGWCNHQGEGTGYRFRYDCDTLSGSSGAAILNAKLEVVGIHNQADDDTSFNAGSYVMDMRELSALMTPSSEVGSDSTPHSENAPGGIVDTSHRGGVESKPESE